MHPRSSGYAPYPPPAQPKSDASTAGILAAVFGLLVALAYGGLVLGGFGARRDLGAPPGLDTVLLWLGLGASAVLLFIGSIALLCRTVAGRILVILGGAAGGLTTVLYAVVQLVDSFDNEYMNASERVFATLFTLLFAVWPLLPAVLAAVSSTREWIAAKGR
ncbi:hypothetical protein AB0C65_33350 [Nocardia sp. NPDC048505]|uniref:hypothetical protein n=1 Tax=Nocardia sp. NPDC048505 TaxID=3155756 RepID=UPI0033F5CF07